MIDERELWACANQLILQHGAGAWPFAAKRAEELLDAGDLQGNSVFMAIANRIQQLEAVASSGMTH